MRYGLDPQEDRELRWLAFIAAHAALTPVERDRLAELRTRDRRDSIRPVDSDEGEQESRRTVRPAGGEAYMLARRLVSLVLSHAQSLHEQFDGGEAPVSLGDLVAALPEQARSKAHELLTAIDTARN